MTRKWSNLNLPGALHFVTGIFIDRLPVFTEAECCKVFLSALNTMNKIGPASPENEEGHQVWQESFKAVPLWSGWMGALRLPPSGLRLIWGVVANRLGLGGLSGKTKPRQLHGLPGA